MHANVRLCVVHPPTRACVCAECSILFHAYHTPAAYTCGCRTDTIDTITTMLRTRPHAGAHRTTTPPQIPSPSHSRASRSESMKCAYGAVPWFDTSMMRWSFWLHRLVIRSECAASCWRECGGVIIRRVFECCSVGLQCSHVPAIIKCCASLSPRLSSTDGDLLP